MQDESFSTEGATKEKLLALDVLLREGNGLFFSQVLSYHSMKKQLSLFLLFATTLLTACSSEEGNLDKFVGTWQSVKVPNRPLMLIKKKGDNITISETSGKNEMPASYDKEHHKLVLNMPMVGALDVIYFEETDYLLITEAGEYTRVK
jgi:hypothetical protein